MTDSLPVAAFLTTQYDKDEKAARAATIGPWSDGGGYPTNGNGDGFGEIWVLPPADNEYEPDEATAVHIARWDPVRVLADIAAKRALLALWQRMDADLDSPGFHQAADELLAQLLVPYGKRAVFTRDGNAGPLSWRLEDA